MRARSFAAVGLGLVLAFTVVSAEQLATDAAVPKTEKELRSYALGMDLGTQLRKLSVEVDPAVFARGLGDALAGTATAMNEEEVKAAISRLQAELKARHFKDATGKDVPH